MTDRHEAEVRMGDEIQERGRLQAMTHGRWDGVASKLREVVWIATRRWPKHDVPVVVDLLEVQGQPTAWKVEVAGEIVLWVYKDGEKIKVR